LPDLPRKLKTPASAAAVLAAAFCLAYAGDAGRGFVKDDFRWVRETRLQAAADIPRLFVRSDGFYRPVVSLSFAVDSAAFGIAPRAFGLTNLALALACAALVGVLAARLGAPPAAALLAAGVWAFNFHGINMAVLWISGRTSLVVTLFALLTGIAVVSGRTLLAGLCCFLALLSKEEAFLLPVVVAAWSAHDGRGTAAERLATAARRAWPCFAALVLYILLRLRTDAFWPAGAPDYYRFTFSPAMIAGNLLQYADRAMTWPAASALVACIAARRLPRLHHAESRIVIFGAIWLVGAFALTVWVPARSSLYAVLPSAGSALAAGAIVSAAMRAAPRAAARAIAALALLPLLLLPVYWARNERWVCLAGLSTHVLHEVRAAAEREPDRRILIVDDPSERFNLDAAFGSLWPDAAALFLPPGSNATIASGDGAPPDALVLRLRDGRLVEE
jgi:hypothetical protein